MFYEVLIGGEHKFKSCDFSDSLNSCLSKAISQIITNEEIEKNIKVQVLFYIRQIKKMSMSPKKSAIPKKKPKKEEPSFNKEEDQPKEGYTPLEEKEDQTESKKEPEASPKHEETKEKVTLIGQLSLPLSEIIRRSLNKEEFRGALKVIKEKDENQLKKEKSVSEGDEEESVVDDEAQFIYEVAANQNANFTDFLVKKMNANCLGFLVTSMTLRVDKGLTVKKTLLLMTFFGIRMCFSKRGTSK